jgi:hypothetical protein
MLGYFALAKLLSAVTGGASWLWLGDVGVNVGPAAGLGALGALGAVVANLRNPPWWGPYGPLPFLYLRGGGDDIPLRSNPSSNSPVTGHAMPGAHARFRDSVNQQGQTYLYVDTNDGSGWVLPSDTSPTRPFPPLGRPVRTYDLKGEITGAKAGMTAGAAG